MINGILAKFQPLKTGEVSVLVTTTKEHLHELVDLQDKGITIQAIQPSIPANIDQKQLLDDISKQMKDIQKMLMTIYPNDYEP